MEEGFKGLLRDKTRPSRIPPLGQVIDKVVALTATEPRHEATRWTSSAMARAAGISVSSVQRIWRAHGLAPLRMRHFKISDDPDFAPRLRDIVGLYVDPPAHAVVLSVDEKSQIQALDRTQRPASEEGPPGTMTHDYKRNGTTTLFAALNVLYGTVIGRNMQRHRHQEFIRFLNAIEAQVPAGKLVAALVPLFGGGELAGPVTAAAADPQASTRAPLFVARIERNSAADSAQTQHPPNDALTAVPVRDVSAIAPQSAGLFVARSDGGGPR
jgi:hypothetical protein